MCILSFSSTGGCKFKNSFPTKIVINQNDRNHSDFHLGMAVLGCKLRLPCYKLLYSLGTNTVSQQTRHKILSLVNVPRYSCVHSGLNTLFRLHFF